ncbi:MAG TPA: ATP-binding cassette domain-containing protein [Acidobacteria bacterium]|nr:ATP-binding cassette domain-containing protein [Acidobacteriota bacterium]
MSAVLAAHGAALRLGAFTLGPLDLEVRGGEYLVLVGPSGAGKTVLLETLIGWFEPDAGAVELDGAPVGSVPPGDRRIAYVPQDLGLLPHLDVRANLRWGLDCRGEPPDPALLATLVEVLALEPILDRRRPETLSRGEQQRVALARALLTRPRILALDEPCAALDPHRRRELQLLLRRLHREHRTTVVHITHDREEAFLLGERIGVLLDGRLHQLGPPRAIYDRPADLAVARFLASENLWPARIVGTGAGEGTLSYEDAPSHPNAPCGDAHRGAPGGRPLPPPTPKETAETGTLPFDPSNRVAEPAAEPGVTVRLEGSGTVLHVAAGGGAPGGRVLAGIRPEEVMLLHPGRPLRPQVAGNIVEGVLEELLLLDGRVQATLRTGDGLRAVVRLPVCAADDLGLAPGRRVRASLKPRSLYILPATE